MTQNKYKLVSTEYFTFISGPCAIESEKMAMLTAEFLKNISEKLNINLSINHLLIKLIDLLLNRKEVLVLLKD